MKLDRALGALSILVVAALAMGCGARSTTAPRSARTPVASAQLMAAELHASDDAPKVGKSQRSGSSVQDGDERGASPHGGRRLGGFSGYK